MLTEAGYRVVTAANGEEALAAVTNTNEAFDALVTDMVMPRMSGTELTERLRERLPEIRVVMISGYPEHEGDVKVKTEAFLAKPFRPDDLLSAVGEILSGTPSQARERD